MENHLQKFFIIAGEPSGDLHGAKLINALRHYHRKFSDKERTYKIKPVHDWSSHACDSLRTLATGIQENKFNQNKRQQVADTNYKVL